MFRSHCCFCILCSLIGLTLVLLLMFATAIPVQAQAKGEVSFINDVMPVLKNNCYACHNPEMKRGKFTLTTYATFRSGGKKGDPVVPGKAKESVLINLLTRKGKGRMPPLDSGDPLSKEQIALISKWINQGAKSDINPKADLFKELLARWKPPQPPATYKFPVVINAVAFTPDNKKLVVGGQHELLLWDLTQARLVRRIYTRAERACDMVFLPDGKLAVAGDRPGQEGDVRIYDLEAGTPKMVNGVATVDGVGDKGVVVAALLQVSDSILGLALSGDGKKLAAGGCDRTIRVWNLDAGPASAKLEHQFQNHAGWIYSLGFSADGKYLATGSRDKTVKVYDLSAKDTLLTFPEHQGTVHGVAILDGGKLAVSASEDTSFRLWPLTKQVQPTKVLGNHGKKILRLAYRADGKNPLLATGGADKTVRLWNPVTGTMVKTLTGHQDWVSALAISPDGNLVAGGSWNGEVRVWQTNDGSLVKAFIASPGFNQASAQGPKQ